ncbi:U-box domain-containing protein 54-like isoform X2 [Juglans regia]|nr:U-box domain-containing protein 54-like isoform X2 [Juglans regia]
MEEAPNHGNTAEDKEIQYCSSRMMSPEIVEIVEDSKSIASSNRDGGILHDVYVAVGKDDLDVLKWALDHAVSPGARVFLVHVFPAITYIPTPVGRLSRSQLSAEQVKVYINEEHNRRRNLLQKYIHLCNEAKVTVETMLLESNVTAKAILELIPILNITNLVMGIKRSPHYSRRLGKKMAKGEFVKKNAPEFCEVTIIHEGKKVVESQEIEEPACSTDLSSSLGRAEKYNTHQSDWNFFECVCFSGKHLNRK